MSVDRHPLADHSSHYIAKSRTSGKTKPSTSWCFFSLFRPFQPPSHPRYHVMLESYIANLPHSIDSIQDETCRRRCVFPRFFQGFLTSRAEPSAQPCRAARSLSRARPRARALLKKFSRGARFFSFFPRRNRARRARRDSNRARRVAQTFVPKQGLIASSSVTEREIGLLERVLDTPEDSTPARHCDPARAASRGG